MLNAGKFETLLGYKAEDGAVSLDVLVEVCRLYLDSAGPPGLEAACTAALGECGSSPSSDAVASAVLGGSGSACAALKALLEAHAKPEASKPVSSALSNLMGEDLADEEDEEESESGDSDSEGSPKKKKKPLEPVMRGILSEKDGKLVWQGKWAFSKDKFDEGEKSKFKCTYHGDCKVSATAPPSGKYPGYFMVDEGSGKPPSKVEEKATVLEFGAKDPAKGWIAVTGSGKNPFGEFTMSGMFDPKSGKLSIVKTYKVNDEYEDDDDDDDDEDGDIDEDDPADAAQELADLQAAAAEDIDDIRKRMREADHKERDGKKAKQ
jgi:hypothetical protein